MAEPLVITRVLHAPRELVFKVWSDVEHLNKWWGPTALTIDYAKLDFKPGGKFHDRMVSPEGDEMWGRFVFGEIIAPEKIVFVNSFSDKEGNAVRAAFNEAFPLEIENILTFEEHDGKTTLTLRGGPINATEAEQQFFLEMFDSMKQGFGGTFDQLETYLASIQGE
ncbi:SRPBCC domain-containing protein [Paenibacillus luteus]|uniref:SRPBCC family protein n=1 Tax=Paenibacillus luteus TaxID=2545753 RepID=UPI0030C7BA00